MVEGDVLSLLQDRVPASNLAGAALVLVAPDGTIHTECAGTISAASNIAVDARTVFEGASFSKPCFALALLKLAQAGEFPLDEPLAPHSQNLHSLGRSASAITARHLISHTSGLPNWRSPSRPFRVWFPPGERFSYSSEGYVCLQQATESLCGKSAEQLARQLVFEPLGMMRTSYVWQRHFEDNHALPHDSDGAPEAKAKPGLPVVAASLHTTAADYGLFLRAVLGVQSSTGIGAEWLAPIIAVPAHGPGSLEGPTPLHAELSWGLGWGLLPASSLIFHWGANPGFRCFGVGSMKERRALAVFTNGPDGLRVATEIASVVFSAISPVRVWLGVT